MPEGSGAPARLDDFDRIVASFNRTAVDFMIIGGYAVIISNPGWGSPHP